ncbi:MAG: SDR family oxidoreductase, partial [bacterium]|nr:SDR family oxidoreductase [bacterium]
MSEQHDEQSLTEGHCTTGRSRSRLETILHPGFVSSSGSGVARIAWRVPTAACLAPLLVIRDNPPRRQQPVTNDPRRGAAVARLTKLSRSIEGKVALVTGAASGMGRATAHLLADQGAKVAVSDLQRETVDTVVKEIEQAGGEARGWVLDVSRLDDIDRVVEEVAGHFGGLDILVNNAGISRPGRVDGPNYEAEWEQTLAVNLTAHARLIRAALPH